MEDRDVRISTESVRILPEGVWEVNPHVGQGFRIAATLGTLKFLNAYSTGRGGGARACKSPLAALYRVPVSQAGTGYPSAERTGCGSSGQERKRYRHIC